MSCSRFTCTRKGSHGGFDPGVQAGSRAVHFTAYPAAHSCGDRCACVCKPVNNCEKVKPDGCFDSSAFFSFFSSSFGIIAERQYCLLSVLKCSFYSCRGKEFELLCLKLHGTLIQ